MDNNDKIYKKIVQNATFGYCLNKVLYDEKGVPEDFILVETNKQFKEMSGTKNKDIEGKRFSEVFPELVKNELNWVEKLTNIDENEINEYIEFHSPTLKKWCKIKNYWESKDLFVSLVFDVTDEIKILQYTRDFLSDMREKIDFKKLTDKLFQITNAAVIVFNLFDYQSKTATTVATTGIGKILEKGMDIFGFKFIDKSWNVCEKRYKLLQNNSQLYFNSISEFLVGIVKSEIITVFARKHYNNPVYAFSIKIEDEVFGDIVIVERKKEKLKNRTLVELYSQILGLVLSGKDMENRYIKTSEDLELVLEATENGYWDCNFETEHIFYNDKYFSMLGYDPQKMPHTMGIWKELMHPLDRNTIGKEIEKDIERGLPYEKSFRLRCKDGQWKWILGKGKGFKFNKNGKPSRALGIHIDIDNLKNIEYLLKEKENHYQALFEYSPTPLWEMDFSEVQKYIKTLIRTGVEDLQNYLIMYPSEVEKCIKLIRINNINNAVVKLLQYKDEKNLSLNYFKILPEKSYKNFIWIFDAIAHHKSDCDFDIKAVTKEGKIIYVHLFWKVIPGYESDLKKVFVTTVEITERVLSKQKIKENEERLKSINDALPDMIFELDQEGKFTYFNSQNIPDLFTEKNNFINKKINDVLPANIAKITLSKIGETLKTEEVQHYEFSMDIEGQQNYFEARMVLKSESNVLVIIRNITDRKHLEEENMRLEQHRSRSQKLETIGTLAGGIAHDFNNLLTPIMGYSDMIKNRLSPNDQMYEDIVEILNASKQARELVEQILSFSREAGTKRKPVYLSDLLKKTMKFIRPAMPDNIKIELEIKDKGEMILADAVKIHQVLLNLTTNAYHAMENRAGILTITLEKIILDNEGLIDYWALESGNEYLQLRISDTGCGMEKSVMDRIFEPFFTTKSEGKGSGMGLSVVHGIIKSHKGAIFVESELDKGTTFTILLPVVKNLKIEKEKPSVLIKKTTEKARILLIDDRDYISKMIKNMLSEIGFEVTIFNNSIAAYEHFENNSQVYDLVITDRTMPDMTGLELSAKIKEKNKKIPIILITGQGHNLDTRQLEQAGIDKLIRKPIMFNEMINSIKQLIDT